MEHLGGDFNRASPIFRAPGMTQAHPAAARASIEPAGTGQRPIAAPQYGFVPGLVPGIPLHAGGK